MYTYVIEYKQSSDNVLIAIIRCDDTLEDTVAAFSKGLNVIVIHAYRMK